MSWVTRQVAHGNAVVVPDGDAMDHSRDHRCVCRPRWMAVWIPAESTVGWMFVHHSLDGREQIEVRRR